LKRLRSARHRLHIRLAAEADIERDFRRHVRIGLEGLKERCWTIEIIGVHLQIGCVVGKLVELEFVPVLSSKWRFAPRITSLISGTLMIEAKQVYNL